MVNSRKSGYQRPFPTVVFLLLTLILSACNQEAPLPTAVPIAPTFPPPTGYPAVVQTQPPETAASAYPATAYPGTTQTPPPTAGYPVPTTESPNTDETIYIPIIGQTQSTPTSSPSPIPGTPMPTPFPVIDFAAASNQLNQQGQALVYNKIGLHTTLLEDKDVITQWMQQLDAAGVPFVLKAVDNAEPLYIAQQMMDVSGVPHVLIYRASGGVPNYELPPRQAARLHWQFHMEKFPPELDPSRLWIETINEPDRLQSEWLAEFALETAALAMADGFRWAAFGWSAGEPEPEHWQGPKMLEFLRLVSQHPDQLAIALHEGSGTVEDAAYDYPFRTGRFLSLFDIADQYGFARPTVLITEFGWSYDDIPDIPQALADIDWAARLYAPFPEVKGVAIWNLGVGCCYADISDEVALLVDPLAVFSLTHYYARPLPPNQAATNPAQYAP